MPSSAQMPGPAQMLHSPPAARVRIALVGAGIYARDAHLPALARLREHFDLVAIYSRSQASAQALAQAWPESVATTTDLPALLARDDVAAVDIVLPIPVQAEIVAAALAAGKHVVSEKPIAPSRAEALRLLTLHRRHPECVWMVAENWRYEEAFVRAAALLQAGTIGRPLLAHWAQYSPMQPQNKYYGSAWRRAGEFAGGLLLDGGVHHVAALRMLLGEITQVAAMVQQFAPDLKPADTLTATLQFAGGAQATYLTTFAAGTPFGAPLTIVGMHGSLRVERGRIEVADAAGQVQVTECALYTGVDAELAAFAAAVRDGAPQRNSPLEALTDLAVIEALLASAQEGSRQAPLAL